MEKGHVIGGETPSAIQETLGSGLLQLFIENIGDYAVFAVDTEGRVLTWSTPAEHLLGYREEEILGEPDDRFYTPEDIASGVPGRELQRAREKGRFEEERWHVRKDGSRVWSDEVTMPLVRDDGIYGFAKVMRDRSEAKRVEEARGYADSIIDTVREPLMVLDASLRVQNANRSFYQIFRVSPQDTENRLLYELGNGQWDIPRLRTALEEILPRQNSFDDFEVEHDFPGIGRKVMLLNARRLRLEGADLILLAMEDVTEQQEIESRFTSLVKNAKDFCIFTLGPDGRITSWNVAAEQVLGYNEAEAVGRPFSFIFSAEDRQQGMPDAELREAREKGRGEDKRWHVRKDGKQFWAEGVVSALRDAQGRVIGFSKILRDKTASKMADRALRANEARFRTLLQASYEVAYQMNADWTEMCYLTGAEFIVDTKMPLRTWLQTYIYPDDQQRVIAAIEKAIRTKSVFELEHRVLRVDGSLGWTLSRAIPIFDSRGEITEWFGMASDVTARKEAGEERERLLGEVQLERDRLSALVAAIGDEVWFIDPSRRITLANPAVQKAFGLQAGSGVDAEELAGRLEVLRADGSPRPLEESPLLRALNGEVIVNEDEIIRIPASGGLRHRQVNASPVKDAGQIIGAVAVTRDIDVRKRAEAALERTRALLSEGQKIGHLGSFEYDVSTGNTAWSEEKFRIYGLDPAGPAPTFETVLQKHIHPDDVHVARANFMKLLQRPGVFEFENRIVRPDGTVRWVFERVLPYYDERGEVVRYVGITQDITDRRRDEEARGRLAAIVEAAQDPIFSYGLDGIIQTWNKGGERLLGYRPEDILGKHITLLLPPEHLHEEAEIMDRLQRGMSDELLDTVRVSKDGRRVNVSVRVTPILDPQGRVIGASKILRDISEHKRLEEEIRQANALLEQRVAERTEELRETIGELERFTYTVAHDLRAPLRGIHRYSELLLEKDRVWTGQEAMDYLRKVTHAAKRMDRLLSDLLTYSRVGLNEINQEALNLRQLAQEAIDTFAAQIEERGAQMKIRGRLPRICGDRVLVFQILANLLSNALKFVPNGRTPKVEIGATAQDGFIRLWVRDNGIGLEPRYRERIFQMFQRLHAEDEYSGTGIGLAIVRRAAQRMGGHVDFESEPGKGSRFWVELQSPGRS